MSSYFITIMFIEAYAKILNVFLYAWDIFIEKTGLAPRAWGSAPRGEGGGGKHGCIRLQRLIAIFRMMTWLSFYINKQDRLE